MLKKLIYLALEQDAFVLQGVESPGTESPGAETRGAESPLVKTALVRTYPP